MNLRRLLNPAFLIALCVMSASAAGFKAAIDHYRFYLKKLPIYAEGGRLLRSIPAETDHWIRAGSDFVEQAETLEVLGTENYVTRYYAQKGVSNGKPKIVQLHVAYYTNMIDTVPHVPERCFTGAGMNLVDGPENIALTLDTSSWLPSPDQRPPASPARLYTTRLSNDFSSFGRGRRVNLPVDLTPDHPITLRISKYAGPNGISNFAGYFFVGNGSWVSSAEGVRVLAFNLTDDYAYYLKVQVGSTDAASAAELGELASTLLSDLLGEIMTCVPDWTKVQRGEWPPDNPKRKQTKAAGQP